jgi:metal-sulfur cluster biosynthetic enzyme
MAVEALPYSGDAGWQDAIEQALRNVVDPEMALNIVDLGLVYGVETSGDRVHVQVTMTSAACPVAELIVDDIKSEIGRALGPAIEVEVELCWEPPWTPERMSAEARAIMGW